MTTDTIKTLLTTTTPDGLTPEAETLIEQLKEALRLEAGRLDALERMGKVDAEPVRIGDNIWIWGDVIPNHPTARACIDDFIRTETAPDKEDT